MTRKEEEGDRYRSEGERVFEKNFQTDHELTRLNNCRLINYSKRRKLLPSPPSIDRSIFRLFTPRSFSDSVEDRGFDSFLVLLDRLVPIGFDQSLLRSKERVSSFLVRIESIGSTDKTGNRLVDVWNFGKGRLRASLREFETF